MVKKMMIFSLLTVVVSIVNVERKLTCKRPSRTVQGTRGVRGSYPETFTEGQKYTLMCSQPRGYEGTVALQCTNGTPSPPFPDYEIISNCRKKKDTKEDEGAESSTASTTPKPPTTTTATTTTATTTTTTTRTKEAITTTAKTPSPDISASRSTESCWEKETRYHGLRIWDFAQKGNIGSAGACQKECQQWQGVEECKYWTWTEGTEKCNLKSGKGEVVENQPGKISGPVICEEQGQGQGRQAASSERARAGAGAGVDSESRAPSARQDNTVTTAAPGFNLWHAAAGAAALAVGAAGAYVLGGQSQAPTRTPRSSTRDPAPARAQAPPSSTKNRTPAPNRGNNVRFVEGSCFTYMSGTVHTPPRGGNTKNSCLEACIANIAFEACQFNKSTKECVKIHQLSPEPTETEEDNKICWNLKV